MIESHAAVTKGAEEPHQTAEVCDSKMFNFLTIQNVIHVSVPADKTVLT